MISFERPLFDGPAADLTGGLFLLWDRGPGALSLQDALLANIIRQRLESLPAYGVFDNVRFELQGNTVILSGLATSRDLPQDAMHAISALPIVEKVINIIELLPDGVEDDMIRAEAYARLYADPVLVTYRAAGALPEMLAESRSAASMGIGFHGIRIVVKRGELTLIGQVASRADVERACRLAHTVHGVVRVDCQLAVSGNWN